MKVPYFTLKQLTYFVMSVRTGKISAAAVELGISQSAITTAILDLENLLGAALLERHPGGIRPTYRGQMFFTHAENILSAASDAQRSPFRGNAVVEGPLRICATYVVCGYFLLPRVAKFRKLFPKIDLSIVEVTRNEGEAMLMSGEVDLSVMLTSNLERADEIESIRLLRSRRQLWVRGDSELASRDDVGLAEIAEMPYCLLQVDDSENLTKSYWNWYGLQPNIRFTTRSMEALRESIALGMGVTIVADLVYRPWSLDGHKIERVQVRESVPQLEMGIAWHRGAELGEPAQVFREFLTQITHGGALD